MYGVAVPADVPPATSFDTLIDSLCDSSPEMHQHFRKDWPALKEQNKALLERCDRQELELAQYRRKLNQHCNEKLGAAFSRWAAEYGRHHATITYRQATRAVRLFIGHVGEDMYMRDVRSGHIQEYLSAYVALGGKTPAARTLRKEYAYLSIFFGWAYVTYDLSENPIAKAKPPKQKIQQRQHITAFKTQDELLQVLRALSSNAYWQAWVAVAVLAGPRWDEQRRMCISHFNPDQNRIAIYGRKTGHLRQTPVESTTLRPLLDAWIATRRKQQADPSSTPALRSDLLFPSLVQEEKRRAIDAHVWCASTNWRTAWRSVRDLVKSDATYWAFTPRDWRHCCASAMGASGVDGGRISDWLGNSEGIARRHYVAPRDARLWTFNWGG